MSFQSPPLQSTLQKRRSTLPHLGLFALYKVIRKTCNSFWRWKATLPISLAHTGVIHVRTQGGLRRFAIILQSNKTCKNLLYPWRSQSSVATFEEPEEVVDVVPLVCDSGHETPCTGTEVWTREVSNMPPTWQFRTWRSRCTRSRSCRTRVACPRRNRCRSEGISWAWRPRSSEAKWEGRSRCLRGCCRRHRRASSRSHDCPSSRHTAYVWKCAFLYTWVLAQT